MFSSDGTRFAVSAYGPDRPSQNNMEKFQPVKFVRVFAVPEAGADFAKSLIFAPQPVDQPITAILWDKKSQLLVMPASNGTVRINDFVATGSRELQRFRTHDGAVLGAAMACDTFVTGGEDLSELHEREKGDAAFFH